MTTTINASTSSGLVVTPDNSGVVQLQYSGQPGPAFNAAAQGSGGGVSVANNAPIIFNTIFYQRGGSNYNASTGLFTAPISGYYMFAVNILIDTTQTSIALDFQLYINSSSSQNAIYSPYAGSAYYWLSASWVVSLTVGDTVGIRNVAGSAVKIYSGSGGDTQTHLSGFLIA
jgi:hypothetical protein